jgi:hypothetical protein
MGFKLLSIKKRIAAQTSLKRKLSLKLPKGTCAITNPEAYLDRKIRDYTTVDPLKVAKKADGTEQPAQEPVAANMACPKCNSSDTGEMGKSLLGSLLKKTSGAKESHYCRQCKHTW